MSIAADQFRYLLKVVLATLSMANSSHVGSTGEQPPAGLEVSVGSFLVHPAH